jgi:methylmalonyl-CoA mutase
MTFAAKLLSEFPPVSTEAWQQAIREDLKGADYAEKLMWRSPEGVDVKPYYRGEDLAGMEFLDAAPGEFPYVRGTRASGGWRIREHVDAVDPEEANNAARCAVSAGAEEIAFTNAAISNASDLGLLLANLGETPVHFAHATPAKVRLVIDRMTRRQGGTLRTADLDWSADLAFSAEVILKAPAELVPFTIRVQDYHNSGATAVEEAAFALASGVDLLAEMQERGVAVDRAADSVAFSFAMGPEFFMQIAKLRAFRMVWAQAVESFGGAREHAKARIYAMTSRWNRTVYDPHVNILRATTETMAAVLGGADSIYVAPFDDCYNVGDEASRRLARNTQIMLKQEAQLARVADAGGGSYYLETLTGSLAERAWKQFQKIETAGGYRKAADTIAQILEQRKAAQQNSVNTRRRILTGTNRFANAAECALDRVGGALVHDSVRAALPFEELRLRTERHARATGRAPRILLAEIGDAKMRAARSSFVADFLACAGLGAETRGFEAPQGIAAAGADMVVLCSSDAEYLGLATELLVELEARGRGAPVLIAGNPENAEQLRAAGITDFIHLRSHPVELLTRLQQLLGISE